MGALILIIACTLPILKIERISKVTAYSLAENSFYVPESKSFTINKEAVLKTLCFGTSSVLYGEETLVLESKYEQSKPKTPSSTANPIEAPANEADDTNEEVNITSIPCDLSSSDPLVLNNTTSLHPDTERLLNAAYDFAYSENGSGPLVLILHTHASECYIYPADENALKSGRTTDTELNMTAVGKTLADTLNSQGISTVHDTTQHDAVSYRDSYSLAADTIKAYLKEYPSIRYVIDLHRDAIVYENGEKARPICEVDGENAAQMMILVGTDAGGADFDHWEKNLSLGLKLNERLSSDYPGLMRSLALRGASYNEQYTEGSLLIEVGAHGNTLAEAKHSAELLGTALADLIKGE